jgi:aldose 1-epimerase
MTAPPQSLAPSRLKLTDGLAELEVTPAGGCITAFRWRQGGGAVDWLRPAPLGDSPPPGETGCFPLVPYSNRIREGRYRFAGRDYQLAQNFAPSPHSIHGHGWKLPWQVAEQGRQSLTLAYRHDGDGWPQPYRCEQRFDLAGGVLTVTLRLTNAGTGEMPAGLGLHPYFPRSPRCRVTATVAQMWETDSEVMPTRLAALQSGADPQLGLVPAEAALDNCFTGFAGEATIDWPERGAGLTLSADAALDHLVVFTPPGRDFFCLEPVSHGTDAVNRAPGEMRRLAPGETFSASVRFLPRLDGAA